MSKYQANQNGQRNQRSASIKSAILIAIILGCLVGKTESASAAPTTRIPSYSPTYTRAPSTRKPSSNPSQSFTPTTSFNPTSNPGGISWVQAPLPVSIAIQQMCMSSDGLTVLSVTNTANSVLYSSDSGQTHNFAVIDEIDNRIYSSIACSSDANIAVIMATTGSGGKISYDYGRTYTAMNFGAMTKQSADGIGRCAVSSGGQNILVIGKFMARSFDNGASFSQIIPPAPVDVFDVSTTFLSSDRGDRVYFSYFVSPSTAYLWKTLDFGLTWVPMTQIGSTYRYLSLSFDVTGQFGMTMTMSSGGTIFDLYSTNNGGASWNALNIEHEK